MLSHEKYQPDFDYENGYFRAKTVYKTVRNFNSEIKKVYFDKKTPFYNRKIRIIARKIVFGRKPGVFRWSVKLRISSKNFRIFQYRDKC